MILGTDALGFNQGNALTLRGRRAPRHPGFDRHPP